MAGARRERESPWSFRIFDAAPLPPVWLGVAFATLLLAGFLGLELTTGGLARLRSGRVDLNLFRGLVTLLLLLAYLPTASFYLARWTRRHVAELQPLLAVSDGSEEAALPFRSGPAVGIAGALSFFVLFLLLPGDLEVYETRDYWTLEHALPWVLVPPVGWLIARLAHSILSDALRVSRLAERLAQLDLLDLSPLAPFAQQGLRSALVVILLISISFALLVDPGPALPSALLNVGALVAIALLALVLPVRGVRRRIRHDKRAQLAPLRARIAAERDALLGRGAAADRAAARLPGLLALEARLDAVREWPFDLSNLLRFALYVTLGLGSWLGAAAVERLLDLALR